MKRNLAELQEAMRLKHDMRVKRNRPKPFPVRRDPAVVEKAKLRRWETVAHVERMMTLTEKIQAELDLISSHGSTLCGARYGAAR